MIPVSNFDWEMKTKMLAVVFLYIYIYILQFRQSQLRFVIIYIVMASGGDQESDRLQAWRDNCCGRVILVYLN